MKPVISVREVMLSLIHMMIAVIRLRDCLMMMGCAGHGKYIN